ncbi:MgtC/SapB family protein [Calidithermus chliarophilus]|uniref:MgtC/SapB family protein n=1 Tax=Calidithermus chliarophilus TaxID=52023 RepID=UPI0003FE9E22|nr:MgtC/SapB family protein [Calidithermus chliarophilus]
MQETLWHLLAATLIGFTVGLEREHARVERQTSAIGGVRTFTLIGLLGGVAALGQVPWLPAVGLAAVAALAVYSLKDGRDATSPVAALTVYVLGVLCGVGIVLPALFAGALLLGFLAFHDELHAFVGGIQRGEVEAAVLLVLLLGVVYPLLPDAGYGPYGVWNPREIWGVVLLVAGVNFAGYLALRLLGPKGLWATALLGGLVSSTAVALSMVARSRASPGKSPLWASGVVLSSQMMLGRVLVWSALPAPVLLGALWLPVLLWLLWGFAAAAWLARRDNRAAEQVPLQNPLQLRSALLFAGVYALVKLLATLGLEAFGSAGVFAVSALSGVADVDAISLSLAQLTAGEQLAVRVAATAVVIAALSNSLFKAALSFGGRGMGAYVALGLLPGGLLALLALLLGPVPAGR